MYRQHLQNRRLLVGKRDMNEENKYATHQELEECERRTNEKNDSLRPDMNAGFLHLVERMDDRFFQLSQRMDDRFFQLSQHMNDKFEDVHKEFAGLRQQMDDNFEDMHKEFARQNEKAEERQKSDRRFLSATLIPIVAVAVIILVLIVK